MSTIPYESPPVTAKNGEGKRILIIFGILLILIGSACAFAAWALVLSAVQSGGRAPIALAQLPPEVDPKTLLLQLFLLLAVLAILLLWIGIGSIRLRRWTRPIVISFSGMFIFGMLVAILQLAAPAIRDRYLGSSSPSRSSSGRAPAPAADFTQDLVLCALVVGGLGLPLLYLYAYRSRAVQLALNENDPTISWTDRAPIPVLALAVALGWTSFLAFIGLIPSPAPYFFEDLYPILDWIFSIALAVFLAFTAGIVYRRRSSGTLLAILAAFIIGVSTMLSETHAMARQTHPPAPALGQLPTSPDMPLIAIDALLAALAYVIPALAYILYANSKMTKS